MPDKENEEILYKFIDNAYLEIKDVQREFFKTWNNQIKRHLQVKGNYCIEGNVDIFGGFLLSTVQYEKMDPELQSFFKDRAEKKGDKVFLRGYGYYFCDPQMHSKNRPYTQNELWKEFAKRWEGNKDTYSFVYLMQERISIENWIGALSLLEYIFTDLTTLRWFEYVNRARILELKGESFFAVVEETERYIHMMGEAIAKLLKFDFQGAFCILSSGYSELYRSAILTDFVTSPLNFGTDEAPFMRVIREGDSLCLVYAAYLMKLEPFCRQETFKKILLISNAFGAMNTGVILKYLLSVDCETINIQYSQNRNDGNAYGEASDNVKIINESLNILKDDNRIIVVIDDSIFTGNSYCHIKKYLDGMGKIYLLPFSFDCNSLKYGRQKECMEMYKVAVLAYKWAKEVGDCAPAFVSFWDWDKSAPENSLRVENMDFQCILDGEDLLLKHLWATYMDKILR